MAGDQQGKPPSGTATAGRAANAGEIFQDIFGLPETGEVDYRTWYKVQEIYVGVTRIAELY